MLTMLNWLFGTFNAVVLMMTFILDLLHSVTFAMSVYCTHMKTNTHWIGRIIIVCQCLSILNSNIVPRYGEMPFVISIALASMYLFEHWEWWLELNSYNLEYTNNITERQVRTFSLYNTSKPSIYDLFEKVQHLLSSAELTDVQYPLTSTWWYDYNDFHLFLFSISQQQPSNKEQLNNEQQSVFIKELHHLIPLVLLSYSRIFGSIQQWRYTCMLSFIVCQYWLLFIDNRTGESRVTYYIDVSQERPSCTCHFFLIWGRECKHIVAVNFIRNPETCVPSETHCCLIIFLQLFL